MTFRGERNNYWPVLQLLLFVSWFGASAQAPQSDFPKDASQIIHALRNGALLVRLHSKSMAIAAYEKAGRHDMAVFVARQQDDENKAIMKAFSDHFTFCKVYFFSSDSSNDVLQGKHSGYFLDDKLKVNPDITLKENFFITGEHGDPDFPSRAYDSTKDSAPNAGLISDAFVLMDDHFHQLPKPFPYYVPRNIIDGKYPWEKRIQRLNDDLRDFSSRFK